MQIVLILLIGLLGLFFYQSFKKRSWKKPKGKLSALEIGILERQVTFYHNLDSKAKEYFEYEVKEFLLNYKITPISTTISAEDRILIAASGVIPIFAFPEWKYFNLTEILVYPDTFNTEFDVEGGERNVLGMVGSGVMGGKMILSKRAIRNGFASDKDGHNTAIHEFVHLVDGADGDIDGLPSVLLEQPYLIPWIELIRQEIINIHKKDSVLRPYGASNHSEFFAVASEYFFEKPTALKKKHPQLYQLLEKIFSSRNA